jgi:transposase
VWCCRAGAGSRNILNLIRIRIGPATRIYLAAGVTDMRKGFEGLYGLVRDRLSCEPVSGHLFLFCKGQRNRLKVLVWEGSGLWVCSKRLEKGRSTWPQSGDAQGKVILSYEELSLLLGGIDLTKTKLLGGLNVSIDSGKSLAHCECSSHSFIASRSGTHRITEEQATVRGVRIRVPEERLRLMRIEKYGTGGEKLSRAQMQFQPRARG